MSRNAFTMKLSQVANILGTEYIGNDVLVEGISTDTRSLQGGELYVALRGENFDGNLRTRHLKDATNLYNTYRHHGLPPSPIAMPGKEAIYAALHPEPGDALYFVAKGDGSHYFSSTLEEHNRAVRKYQINNRKKNYSSKPSR